MHGFDRDLAGRGLNPVAEFDGWKTGLFDDVSRVAKLAGRADENADRVRFYVRLLIRLLPEMRADRVCRISFNIPNPYGQVVHC
jgi:hypothetical protein